jgi:hypothetical protein
VIRAQNRPNRVPAPNSLKLRLPCLHFKSSRVCIHHTRSQRLPHDSDIYIRVLSYRQTPYRLTLASIMTLVASTTPTEHSPSHSRNSRDPWSDIKSAPESSLISLFYLIPLRNPICYSVLKALKLLQLAEHHRERATHFKSSPSNHFHHAPRSHTSSFPSLPHRLQRDYNRHPSSLSS